jgi:hypothetical protein
VGRLISEAPVPSLRILRQMTGQSYAGSG